MALQWQWEKRKGEMTATENTCAAVCSNMEQIKTARPLPPWQFGCLQFTESDIQESLNSTSQCRNQANAGDKGT